MLIKDFIFLSILSLLAVIILNFIGKIATFKFIAQNKQTPFYNFFLESVFGFIVLVTVVSICQCGIYTINIFTLILLASYFMYQRRMSNSFNRSSIRWLPSAAISLSLAGFALLGTILSFIIMYNSGITVDIAFYCRIAESFSFLHKENCWHFFNSHDPIFNGTFPYHYMEMWLGNTFFKLFQWAGYSDLILYKYTIYNSLRIITILGILSVAEKFYKVNPFTFFLSIVISVTDMLFITSYGENSFPPYTSLWVRVNFITYYLFLIPLLINIIDKNYVAALFFSLILVINSITIAPALLTAAGILFIFIILFRKQHRKLAFTLLGITLVFTVLVAGYYKLTGVDSSTLSGGLPLSTSFIIQKTISLWKAILFYMVMLSVKVFLMLLLAFIPLFLTGKREFIKFITDNLLLISFIVLIALCGIFYFQLVPYIDNTYQFTYIGYIACYTFFIFALFYALGESKETGRKYMVYGYLTLFLCISLYYQIPEFRPELKTSNSIQDSNLKDLGISDAAIGQLKQEFSLSSGLNGASILAEGDILNPNGNLLRHIVTAQLGYYVSYIQNNTNIILLNDPKRLYPDTDTTYKDYLKSKSFNKYTLFYKNYNNNLSYLANLEQYINKHNINFLVLSRSYNYHEFDSLPIKKYFRDEGTGTQFLILKN